MDFLVLSDQNGVVDMTPEAIARRTNRPLDIILSTISELERPDERSRTPDFRGARIKRLDEHRDWGWMIVNYEQFRKIASSEQKREKTLARVHKHRGIKRCNAVKRAATPKDLCNAKQKQKEEADGEVKADKARPSSVIAVVEYCKKLALPETEGEFFWNKWEANGYANGKKKILDWKATIRSWKAAGWCPSQKGVAPRTVSASAMPDMPIHPPDDILGGFRALREAEEQQ